MILYKNKNNKNKNKHCWWSMYAETVEGEAEAVSRGFLSAKWWDRVQIVLNNHDDRSSSWNYRASNVTLLEIKVK